MPVDKNSKTLVVDGCWRWTNGTTWHPKIWHGNRADPDPEVECFEVAWDADGKPTITGNTAMMTSKAAMATQRSHEDVAYAESQPQGPVEVTVL